MTIDDIQVPVADIRKFLDELNASFEAELRQRVSLGDASSVHEIDLSEPFDGIEWGVVEWNVQRQKWRWLGTFGESHLFLNLPSEKDHLIRVSIHTATSVEVLESLTAFVDGVRCTRQGYDWGADGGASHWCIVEPESTNQNAVVKITWRVATPTESQPQTSGRLIAFSRINCTPYERARLTNRAKAAAVPYELARHTERVKTTVRNWLAPMVAAEVPSPESQPSASDEERHRGRVTSGATSSVLNVPLDGPFDGSEWGAVEMNDQQQVWRWLGPRGQSHALLKLSTDTDHLIRLYVHTAVSIEVLEGLTAFVEGVRCEHQGYDWGPDGIATHWCIVGRDAVARLDGVAKISWRATSHADGGAAKHPGDTKLIAFSRMTCEPYQLARLIKPSGKAEQGPGAAKPIDDPYTVASPQQDTTRARIASFLKFATRSGR